MIRPFRHPALGFWSAAFALAVVMAYSAVPTPLYALYQEREGFSTLMITVIFASYAVGVVLALFFAGHLSDWIGRRRALVPAILLAAVTAVLFVTWSSLPGLLVARVLSGLAVGVVTSTATAYLIELHVAARPGTSPHRAQTIAGVANLGGIGFGPLAAGIVAQWAPQPLRLPFLVGLGALTLAAVLVLLAPETRARPVPRPRYRPQRVSVPADARGRFFAAATAGAIAFAAFSIFTALAPTFLVSLFDQPSRAIAGAGPAIVFGAAVLAQLAAGARGQRELLVGGVGTMLAGLGVLVTAVWLPTPSLLLFLGGGGIMGAGAGLLFKGALTTVGQLAPADRRAEVAAGFFLAGYLGLSLPVVGLGLMAQALDPRLALAIFAGVMAAAVLVAARTLVPARASARPAESAAQRA